MSVVYDWIETAFTPAPNVPRIHPTLGPLTFTDGGSFLAIGFSGVDGAPMDPFTTSVGTVFNDDGTLSGGMRLGNGSQGFFASGNHFAWNAIITADGLSGPGILESGYWFHEVPEPSSIILFISLVFALLARSYLGTRST